MEGLNHLLNLYTEENDELEIRFGFYTPRGFTAGITQFAYHYFLNHFTKEYPTLDKITNVCILKRYPNGLRSIDQDGGSACVSKKERKEIIDLQSESLRLALSKEHHDITDLPVDPDSYTMKFKRIRTTFIDNDGGYRIDISHNLPIGKTRISPYEFEIEFLEKPSLQRLQSVIRWASEIYSYMKKYYLSVIYRFNDFFRNEVRVKHELYVGFSKPINVKVRNIPFLTNYVFSPKPNGVSYFLFFDKFGVYYINETEVIKVYEPIRELYGTIVLGEYMPTGFGNSHFKDKGIYLGYDTLFLKGKDVRGLSTIDRNNQMEIVRNYLPNFSIVPMFFSGDSPTHAIKQTFDFIHANFKPEENDGMIMKHNYSHYNFKYDKSAYKYPVWKWKPSEHITIDFSVACDPDYKSKNACGKYQIFVGVPDGEIDNFTGTTEHPYDGYVEIPEDKFGLVHAGTILEFGWDSSTQKLIPTRVRDDKVKPNFHITAESTWEDIFHPITEQELVNLSVYCINRNEESALTARKVCEFIEKTMDAGVLVKLGEYLGSGEIPNTFAMGFKIARKAGVRNKVVEAIQLAK